MSDPVATERPDARLTVVCADGETIGWTNFEAIDSGVLLFEDPKRNRVVGVIPHTTRCGSSSPPGPPTGCSGATALAGSRTR